MSDRRTEGSGFVAATVVDPVGKLLGVMCNPYYVEILAAKEVAMGGQQG
ncbi:hypothetical protein ABT346_14545 [Micromonospora peucetia]